MLALREEGHEVMAVWSTGSARDPIRITPSSTTIDLAIRLGFLGLLGYWSFRVIAPLLTIGLWSVILAVALYPQFARLEARLGARVAAALVTLLSLMVVVGPVTWLGLGMIGTIRGLAAGVDAGQLPIPLPPEAVKSWPIIGERVHELWSLAANNIKVALAQLVPMLKPLGIKSLDLAQGALFSLLELLISIVIAGFLFARGPQLVDALSAFVSRILSQRGKELVQLAGATIRNVSREVEAFRWCRRFSPAPVFWLQAYPPQACWPSSLLCWLLSKLDRRSYFYRSWSGAGRRWIRHMP